MATKRSRAAAPRGTRAKARSADSALPIVRNPYYGTIIEAQERRATPTSATFQLFQESLFNLDSSQESYDKLLDKYGGSSTWVYIAVNRIATSAAQIPVHVINREREGMPNAIVRSYDFGLRQLIDRPNPYQSQMEFIEACMTSLELTGNLFVEKVVANGSGRPVQLYVLNPSRITIVPDTKKLVRGYIYSVNGKYIGFGPDEIIHVKYTHPSNDYYGLSPLTAAKLSIDVDQAAIEWNRTYLLKGGWPGGAIETDADLDKATIARLKREIRGSLNVGKSRAGQILLLTGGLRFNRLTSTPKEMDWLDARRFSRDEILAIFGVPFAVAGLFSTEQTTARSAGVEQQIRQFYRGTVCARLKRLLDAFNRSLVPAFSPRFKLVPDLRSVPALADDVNTELIRAQAARTLVEAGFPLNQVMARFYPEMEPVPWGDVAFMPQNVVAVSGPFNPLVQAPPQNGNRPKATGAELRAEALKRILSRCRAGFPSLPQSIVDGNVLSCDNENNDEDQGGSERTHDRS